jgi:predicted kinase
MDLDATGHPTLANRALNAWLEHIGDYAGVALLPFYLCYRAMVRAKVAATQAEYAVAQERTRLHDELKHYVTLAQRYTEPARPFLLVMHGLSGSGKSTLSLQLVEHLGLVRLRSDVERKRMFDLAPRERSESGIDSGIYAAQTTDAVYRRLLQLAELVLHAGYGAVLDATYLRHAQRSGAFDLARRLDVPCALVDCRAPKETLAHWIEQRARNATDASEADLRVLERQIATQEPLTDAERARTVAVDARAPFDVGCIRRQLACLTTTPAKST